MRLVRSLVRNFVLLVLLMALVAGGVAYRWATQPLEFAAQTIDLEVESGSSVRDIANSVAQAGVQVNPTLLYWWLRLSGKSKHIKAGSYQLDKSTTPLSLLEKFVQGEESTRSITLLEGWTFRQVRQALQKADALKPTSLGLTDEEIMRQLGRAGEAPEGRFFPDTYNYSKGSSDIALLQRAARAMDKKLALAWQQRDPTTSLQSPEQALILASIVEKETGSPSDRAMIAAVFHNRLRIGMRLQTDPSVIYGLGAAFDGNLKRSDLNTDTPWNTYTRAGLPPTPIAMPGHAALLAAVKPAHSKALYFVARGDGSSQFSTTLEEHNQAVNKYQRGQ